MRTLSVCAIAAMFIIHTRPALAAPSFDCAKAQTSAEHLICADDGLAALDAEMAEAFAQSLARAKDPARRQARLSAQRQWLAGLSTICGLPKLGEVETARRTTATKCVGDAYQKRVAELQRQPGIFYAVDDQRGRAVCNAVFSTVSWEGAAEVGDTFRASVPKAFSPVEWKDFGGVTSVASFDLLNSGSPSTVYRVDRETVHFNYTWYILPAPGEEELIKQQLRGLDGDNLDQALAAFANKLTQAVITQRGALLTADQRGGGASPLESALWDTSTTDAYGNWYTRSEVFVADGVTYFLTTSVNNLRGPTVALFKAAPAGHFDLVCSDVEAPSKHEKVLSEGSSGLPCPAPQAPPSDAQHSIAIPWRKDSTKDNEEHATIELPEYRSKFEFIRSTIDFGHYETKRISIRPASPAADDASKNSDNDLLAGIRDNDSWDILLTEAGTYVVAYNFVFDRRNDAPPLGTEYFKLSPKGLTSVCRIEDQVTQSDDAD
jgi:uncharacterized protein